MLIKSENVTESVSGNTFAYHIPANVLDNSTTKLFLFEDVFDEPDTFGSDDFHSWNQQMSLRIFIPKNDPSDFTDLKMRIIKALRVGNFYPAQQAGGIILLPDTDKLLLRMIFNRTIDVE